MTVDMLSVFISKLSVIDVDKMVSMTSLQEIRQEFPDYTDR